MYENQGGVGELGGPCKEVVICAPARGQGLGWDQSSFGAGGWGKFVTSVWLKHG
jgi:hypothetical protein